MILSNSIFDIPIVNNVIIYDETDSTNNRAKEFGNNGCVHGTLILADQQTAGKGRMGRTFISPKGHGIYMSLLVKPDIEASLVSQITLLSAISVSRAIQEVCSLDTQIKWPNDIVCNGKKLVGILTELSLGEVRTPATQGCSDMDYASKKNCTTDVSYVVIGIGINVNNDFFPDKLSDTATSIFLETGKNYSFESIIKSVLSHFGDLYNSFIESKNLDFIKEEYNNRLISLNKQVYIIPNEITATNSNPALISTEGLDPHTCLGIDCHGNLICQDKYSNILAVNSGEVSLRGVNSYT